MMRSRRIRQFIGLTLAAALALPARGPVLAQEKPQPKYETDLAICLRNGLLAAIDRFASGSTPAREVRRGAPFETIDLRGADAARLRGLRDSDPPRLAIVDSDFLRNEQMVAALRESRTVLCLRNNDPDVNAGPLLRRPVGDPEVISTLPMDAEGVERVWNSPAAQARTAVDHLRRAGTYFKRIPGARTLTFPRGGRSLAQDLMTRAADHSSDRLLVVVAHSEDGRIQLPDGSAVDVGALHAVIEKSGRPGLLLSCNTAQAGDAGAVVTVRDLGALEVARALHRVQSQRPAKDMRFGDYVLELQDALAADQKGVGLKIILITTAAAAVGTFAVAYGRSDDCERPPCRK